MEQHSRKVNAGTPPADPEPTPKASFAFQPTFKPPVSTLAIDTPSTSQNNTDVTQKEAGGDAANLSLATVSSQEMPPCQHCSAQPQSNNTKDEFQKILDSQAEQLSQSRRKLAASEEEKYKLSDDVIRESAAKALLQGRIEELQQSMELLRTEKTVLEGQISDERRAKEEAQRSRDNVMEEVKQAEATKHENELAKIKEQMDKERRDYADEIRGMNEVLKDEKTKTSAEKAEKEEVKKQVEKLKEETTTMKASNSRLLNAQNNLNLERTERKVEKKKFEEEIGNLKKEVSSTNEAKTKLQSEVDERKSKIEELERRINTLESDVATAAKEKEKLECALQAHKEDESKAKIEEMEKRINVLEANVATASKDKERLESALQAETAKQKEQKENSDRRINMINTSSNEMRSNLEKKTVEVTQLKSKLESLARELVTERVEVQRLTDEHTAACNKINKMEKERQEGMKKVEMKIAELKDDIPIKDVKRLQSELQAEKDVRECEKRLHNKEIDALKEENLRKSNEHNKQITTLTAQLEAEKQKMNKRTSSSKNAGKLLAALIYACDSDMKEAFMQNSIQILNDSIPATEEMISEADAERASTSRVQSESDKAGELSPRQGSSMGISSPSDKDDQPQSRKRQRKD